MAANEFKTSRIIRWANLGLVPLCLGLFVWTGGWWLTGAALLGLGRALFEVGPTSRRALDAMGRPELPAPTTHPIHKATEEQFKP